MDDFQVKVVKKQYLYIHPGVDVVNDYLTMQLLVRLFDLVMAYQAALVILYGHDYSWLWIGVPILWFTMRSMTANVWAEYGPLGRRSLSAYRAFRGLRNVGRYPLAAIIGLLVAYLFYHQYGGSGAWDPRVSTRTAFRIWMFIGYWIVGWLGMSTIKFFNWYQWKDRNFAEELSRESLD
jgi:hypothetical protein